LGKIRAACRIDRLSHRLESPSERGDACGLRVLRQVTFGGDSPDRPPSSLLTRSHRRLGLLGDYNCPPT
jgi:hypothetical protein